MAQRLQLLVSVPLDPGERDRDAAVRIAEAMRLSVATNIEVRRVEQIDDGSMFLRRALVPRP
jgi:hypothetical protein